MDLTPEEKQEIIQEVVNEITTQSTSIDELPTVSSLAEATSLPAYKRGTSELVRVPIEIIAKPAVEAAETANMAASSANSAAEQATLATDEATKAAANAETAAETANNAADGLKEQIGDYKLKAPTESEYENMEVKDKDTFYFCVADEDGEGGEGT